MQIKSQAKADRIHALNHIGEMSLQARKFINSPIFYQEKEGQVGTLPVYPLVWIEERNLILSCVPSKDPPAIVH